MFDSFRQQCQSHIAFVADEAIPPNNYSGTIDVKGDGYCGFRTLALLLTGDEEDFHKIKRAMLSHLEENINMDRDNFHYPVAEVYNIVKEGTTIVSGTLHKPYSSKH
ncbi:hypothetical protein EC973_002062 [Apophysomyces ossiformis]|uniref:OTU domain-containing protein n=1 Tax=Apophysomyces ossiformis TaxID=679940 RepID=A0A8H7BP93_9FUNG|nr:hypothetical protein EC973_002062 [Apophysomyces ossiformis]